MASLRTRPATTTFTALLFAIGSLAPIGALAADATVTVADVTGEVSVRAPDGKEYSACTKGAKLKDGTRLRTGAGAEAKLKFPDGSESKVKPSSELIVRASNDPKTKPNGAVLFLGRVWSSVVKSSGGESSFEVRSANAVAGVRGTEFDVGVALDGSTRVVVEEGEVGVEGESEEDVPVKKGQEIESSSDGKLEKPKDAPENPDWDGWFSARAKAMEKQGLKVAKALDGRLNRRKAKVEKLLAEQKALRKSIESLEARKKRGEPVQRDLEAKLAQLEKVTARLEDMKSRLEGAFGLFEKWGAAARKGGMADGEAIGKMSADIAKVAADFADMIEEGTDLSEEGMDDMMDDMQKGKRDRPGDSAADELFR